MDKWGQGGMCGLLFAALGVMLVGIVPKFDAMWHEAGVSLPWSGAALVACSRWTCRWWFLYVPAAVGLTLWASRAAARWRAIFDIALYLALFLVIIGIAAALGAPRMPVLERAN